MPKSKDFDYGQNKGRFHFASIINNTKSLRKYYLSNPNCVERMNMKSCVVKSIDVYGG